MTGNEVYPGVFIGDLTAAHFFQGPKLCVRDQPADYLFSCVDDLQVHYVYGRTTLAVLEKAAEWLDSRSKEGRSALVHCSGGIHRSGAIVAYWLATRHGMALNEAYALIRSRRPEIEPREEWVAAAVRGHRITAGDANGGD